MAKHHENLPLLMAILPAVERDFKGSPELYSIFVDGLRIELGEAKVLFGAALTVVLQLLEDDILRRSEHRNIVRRRPESLCPRESTPIEGILGRNHDVHLQAGGRVDDIELALA